MKKKASKADRERFIEKVQNSWTQDWVLFAYQAANYYDEDIFWCIVDFAEESSLAWPVELLDFFNDRNIYHLLTDPNSRERFTLNH